MAKQNLGMVTAYAYAVVGGYEGTEAEFEALLGNIATDLAEIENLTVIANTLPPGSSATASYDHGVLTLGIPKGDKGDTGAGATVTAGTTATGSPGTNASVTNSGTTKDAVFNFTIPRGDTGNGIESIYLTGTSGAVKTYTILFTDGTTTTFDVTDGEVTLAELASVLPTDTASGSIASFPDGSDLFDYLSCIVNIEPVQAGSGTPAPDNVRPITGWTGCNVVVSPTEDAQDGTTYPVSWQTEAGTVYGGKLDVVTGVLTVDRFGITFNGSEDWQASSNANRYYLDYNSTTFPYKWAADATAISNQYEYYGIASSSTYLPDGKFMLWAPAGFPANTLREIIVHNTSVGSLANFKAYLTNNPLQVVYDINDPQTYQLDPVQVDCLLGQNNVWADCGDIEEVKYKADVQKWVEKQLRVINTAILALS